MMRTTTLVLLGTLALTASLGAQTLNANISPNPALVGQTVSLSVSDALGSGAQLPSGCLVTSVTMGGPAGIGIEMIAGVFCTAVITPIPSCASGGSLTGTWNPNSALGGAAPPGRYWFNVQFWDATFTALRTESFPFTINATPSDPTLAQVTPPMIGTLYTMQIASAADAGNAYVCATSATTNTGIPIGSLRSGLDPDAIFLLSFPSPLPAIFLNYQGALDLAGNSPAIGINLPAIPALQCLSLHTEAAILPAGGGQPRLTNTLHAVIQ